MMNCLESCACCDKRADLSGGHCHFLTELVHQDALVLQASTQNCQTRGIAEQCIEVDWVRPTDSKLAVAQLECRKPCGAKHGMSVPLDKS